MRPTFWIVLIVCLLLPGGRVRAVPDVPDVKTIETERAKRRRRLEEKKKERGNVGRDIRKFGEEVATRLDRIVQRKAFDLWGDPWTLQGIPLIFPGGSNGFHLGLRVAVQNIEREDPHKFQFEAQVLASDKGRYKHLVGIDAPWAFGSKYRIRLRASYDRDISQRYFGIGNETFVDPVLLDQESVLYQTIRAWPALNVTFLKNFGRHTRIGPILGLKWSTVTVPPGSLLDRDMPVGVAGGKTHFLGLAFEYNTLDFEPYPSRGTFHEFYLAIYDRLTGSDYNFIRGTYTHRNYTLIHPKLIFAYRYLFEALSGNVPWYELSSVGGSDSTIGFGGDRFLRGFDSNRFIDKIKMVLGLELRWDPMTVNFAGQKFTLGLVPFFDIGRVWPSVLPLRLGTWHASTGWGTRIVWNNRFVVRADFAVNSERTSLFFELGHSF